MLLRLTYFLLLLEIICTEDVYVTIRNGVLKGKTLMDWKGSEFDAYQSIPYAQPPIGELRFQKPVRAEKWQGVRNATEEVPRCVQVGSASEIIGQEDCLYLNVYTHRTAKHSPVFVYIHGGGFLFDSSESSLIGPNYLMTEDIVFVTMNYRLGAFGNLMPNLAFYDQLLALEWVRNNIKYFGGNPKSVTLGGESVGGMSAHLHMLSPLSRGLFHRIICMSGTGLHSLVYINESYTQNLARNLGIISTNRSEIIEAIKPLTVAEIVNASQQVSFYSQTTLNYAASAGFLVEEPEADAFLSEHPVTILKHRKYHAVPMLIGFTNMETRWLDTFANRSLVLDLNTSIPFYVNDSATVHNRAKSFYKLNGNLSDVSEELLHTFLDDIWFRYHAYRSAKYHKDKVYFYVFSGNSNLHYIADYYNINYEGAAHTDDLSYLFSNSNITSIEPGSLEEVLIERMVHVWTSFIRNGKPNLMKKRWPQFRASYRGWYINITNDGFVIDKMQKHSFNFWDSIYQQFTNGLF